MPGCCVPGCTNRSEHGIRLFSLPKGKNNEHRRKLWIENIGREDLSLQSVVVCELHFTEDQFENKRCDNKKLLKWNAVPTLCATNNDNVIRRSTRKRKMVHVVKMDSPDSDNLSDDDSNYNVSTNEPSSPGTSRSRVRQIKDAFLIEDEDESSTADIKFSKKNFDEENFLKAIGVVPTVKLGIENKNKNEVVDSKTLMTNKSKPRRKNNKRSKKLFDEEGFLKSIAEAAAFQIVPSDFVQCNMQCTDSLNKTGSQNATISNQVVSEVSKINTCKKKSNNHVANSIPLQPETIVDNTNSISEESELHNKTQSRNDVSVTTSTLEEFAEVISEEQVPNPRVSISSPKRKVMKKVVRVSTENICRICGKLSEHLIPIHNDIRSLHHIPTLINLYLPIKVRNRDSGWPKNMCENCLNILTEWDALIKKCKQNDVMYGKLLNQTPSSFDKDNISNDTQCSTLNQFDHNNIPSVDCGSNDNADCIRIKLNNKDNDDDDIAVVTYTKDNKNAAETISDNDGSKSNDKRVVDEGNSTNEKSNLKKHGYKIGITLVKNGDSNKDSDLDFNSLKSILISKVQQLFNSLCNDKSIGKYLVKETTPDVNNQNKNINEGESVDVIDCEESKSVGIHKVNKKNYRAKKVIKKNIRTKSVIQKTKSTREIKKKKEDEGSYLCSDCGTLAKDRKRFLSHKRTFHVEKVCMHCNVTLPSLQVYRWHLKSAHVDKISNNCCELCGATFIQRERLERHKLIIHNVGEYFYCDVCNKKCASKQQLHCHKNDAHNKLKNVCLTCSMTFQSHQSYLAHLRKKHGIHTWKGETFPCSNCGRLFNRRTVLEHHMLKCVTDADKPKVSNAVLSANSKMYTCLICSVKITDLDILKQHMNYHADDENIKNLTGTEEPSEFHCTICNCYFVVEKDLALHRFYAHQEPPFICKVSPDCNMTFWKRMSMIMHQMTFHKLRNNICKICSESFSDFRERRRHMKKCHPAEMLQDKSHVCPVCERRFWWGSTLKTHMVIHSDVKTHKCHLCDKAFKLKAALFKHLLYHKRKQQADELKEKNELLMATDFLEVVQNTETETIPKDAFDMASDVDQTFIESPTNLVKVYNVFKCSECDIMFTEKEVRDSHYYDTHVKEELIFKLDDNMDNSENVG